MSFRGVFGSETAQSVLILFSKLLLPLYKSFWQKTIYLSVEGLTTLGLVPISYSIWVRLLSGSPMTPWGGARWHYEPVKERGNYLARICSTKGRKVKRRKEGRKMLSLL